MTNEIRMLKLVNGDVVVGRVTGGENATTIKNPLMVIIVPTQDGTNRAQVAMIDWIAGLDQDEVVIDNAHIICNVKGDQQFETQWIQRTTSGNLVIPTGSGGPKIITNPPEGE